MADIMHRHDFAAAGGGAGPTATKRAADVAIGMVIAVSGAGCELALDPAMLDTLSASPDPALAAAGQVGCQVRIRSGATWIVASIRTLSLQGRDGGSLVAQADFLGEGDEERLTGKLYGFRRGVTRLPTPGAAVHGLSTPDLQQVYAPDDRATVAVGAIHPTRDIRAALYVDALLGKHFALVGSTGTGKSTATALILHRICDASPGGHIVMIDPHGEYGAAFRSRGEVFDASNLQMPYWLMNFEEHCEAFVTAPPGERQTDADILARCLLIAKGRNRLAADFGRLTVDTPTPYLLSDLSNAVQAEMGKLDRATDTAPYLRLRTKIDEIKADPRYAFMFSGMLVADTMAPFIGRILRMPANGRPISIIDVSSLPSEITSVVVAMLSRMVLDYAMWSRGEPQRPVLLVYEEAHRYVPSDRDLDRSASVARILSRIAKEGRKYGVSLGLVTQRPSDLAEGVLSQCGTIIAMRLNNDRDQAHVRAAMPEGSRGFIDTIPALRNREGVICGEGVAAPIRMTFDTLEDARRPASGDPLFSSLWREGGDDEGIVERTVKRWRAHGR